MDIHFFNLPFQMYNRTIIITRCICQGRKGSEKGHTGLLTSIANVTHANSGDQDCLPCTRSHQTRWPESSSREQKHHTAHFLFMTPAVEALTAVNLSGIKGKHVLSPEVPI